MTSQDLHAAGAAYWGLVARREIGRAKHVPQANPSKAIALAAVAAHHGLIALGMAPGRPDYGKRESDDGSTGTGDLPERPI